MTDRARVALKTFCMALFIDLYSYSQFLFFFWGGGGDYVQDHTQCMFSNLQEINTLELEPTKKGRCICLPFLFSRRPEHLTVRRPSTGPVSCSNGG